MTSTNPKKESETKSDQSPLARAGVSPTPKAVKTSTDESSETLRVRSLNELEKDEQEKNGTYIENLFDQYEETVRDIESAKARQEDLKEDFVKQLKLLKIDGRETVIHREEKNQRAQLVTKHTYIFSKKIQDQEENIKTLTAKLKNAKELEKITGEAILVPEKTTMTASLVGFSQRKKTKKV